MRPAASVVATTIKSTLPTAIKAGVMAHGVASYMYPRIVVREAWQVKRAHIRIWRISPERLPIAARSADLGDGGGYGQRIPK